MPELPEVETTRLGISPHLVGKRIAEVIVRRHDLRLPVSPDLSEIEGTTVRAITRRSKYLTAKLSDGSHLLIHLGMSGSLRICKASEDWKTHDHLALQLGKTRQLRFHDPRRFGIFTRVLGDIRTHPLLNHLGPEPLGDNFTAAHLARALAKRHTPIKVAIMDAKVVVGVGNIYASEALFRAGIRPSTSAARVSKLRLAKLVEAIRTVLSEAIAQGGTTLRDFLHSDGQPGYFKQQLNVYDRKNQPCRHCAAPIRHTTHANRSTYWCPKCQS